MGTVARTHTHTHAHTHTHTHTHTNPARFVADELNKVKNMCSRVIKDKMKAKEDKGGSAEVPAHVAADLAGLTEEAIVALTVAQVPTCFLAVHRCTCASPAFASSLLPAKHS